MTVSSVLRISLLLFTCICNVYGQDSIVYPKATIGSQTDLIWGKAVRDPYRWMEDIKSPEVKQWLEDEQKITDNYSGRTYSLKSYLQEFGAVEYYPVFKRGTYYFYYGILSEYQTAVLYYKNRPTEGSMSHFLFDPITIDKSGHTSIDDVEISSDNKTLALMLSKNGSDWNTIRFLDMKSEKLLADTINFVKYSDISWFKNGLFYCKYNVHNTGESFKGNIAGFALYYHKLGTNQKDDSLVYKPSGNYIKFGFDVSVKNKYIVIYDLLFYSGKKYHKVCISRLNDSLKFSFKDFIITQKDDIDFDVIGMLNGKLLVQTNLNAPNGVIYKYDPNGLNKGERFIGEFAQRLDCSMVMGQNKIVSAYYTDSSEIGVIRDSTGKTLHAWTIPDGYTFTHFSGEENDSILIFGFDSFFNPPSMYNMNINTYETNPISKTYINYNNNGLTTRKVYYKSKDSTVIPMYITYKTGMKLDGNNPTILYGYGGFDIKMEPFFDPANVIFIKTGGILVTPCLRGGGDYPGWHEKGMRLNKQNTFDDFIAAAGYLISKKYTNPQKLAAMGGSNGGLTVCAAMLQRPDLFKVVVSESGLLDMLRYHLYNIGYLYKDEYGNITDSTDFINLIKYTPVQNVKKGVNYPATLLVAGDNDDRVNPFNSFKFLATLQANGAGINPYVLYYQKSAGHSGNDVFEEDSKTEAYIYAFIFKYLGVPSSKIDYGIYDK